MTTLANDDLLRKPPSVTIADSEPAKPPPSKNAQTLKRLRAEAVAQGLCFVCRCRPVKPFTRYCLECLERSRTQKRKTTKKRRNRRLCTACGGPRPRGQRRCDRCNEIEAARERDRLGRRYREGICARCEAARLPDRTMCAMCLDGLRTRAQGDRGERSGRRCSICRSPDHYANAHDYLATIEAAR